MLLAAVSVLVLLTRLHYAPVLAQLAALQLDNQASAAINDAVQDTLTAEEITYDKLVELEKDTQGNVTAVRSNVAGAEPLPHGADGPDRRKSHGPVR